ncbi:MAG: hypothetical protein ACXVDA_25630 [Ktedonobacterales bacterium]
MHISARFAALRYEIRIIGPLLFAVLLLVAVGLTGFAILLDIRHVSRDFIAQLVTATLEACLPLTAGILLATAAPHDDAIEVQVTLARPYRITALSRFTLLLGWTVLVEALALIALHSALPWVFAGPRMAQPLTWLAPTLWLATSGVLLALLMRNRSSSIAVLGCIWVCQLIFHGYFASYGWAQPWFLFATLFTPSASFWLANRVELIATAAGLAVLAWAYLHNTEWRFLGEEK